MLEVVDVGAAGLGDRPALGSGDDDLGGDPPAQFRLSLCAGEPVARASATLGPEAPLDAPAADAPGAVVGLAPVAVGTNEQLPGAVGALTHAGNYVACMGGAQAPKLEPSLEPRRILGAARERAKAPINRASSMSSGGGIRTRDLRVMSPTSYQTAPPRVAELHDSNLGPSRATGASGARTARIPLMARVFVSRKIPGDALERLAAEHDVEVWPGDMPPPREDLLAGVARGRGAAVDARRQGRRRAARRRPAPARGGQLRDRVRQHRPRGDGGPRRPGRQHARRPHRRHRRPRLGAHARGRAGASSRPARTPARAGGARGSRRAGSAPTSTARRWRSSAPGASARRWPSAPRGSTWRC